MRRIISKKSIARMVSCSMVIVLAGVSTYGYTTYANEENISAVTEEATDNKTKLGESIDDIVSVAEKEIGKDETVYIIADSTGNATSTIVSEHLKNNNGADVINDKSDLDNIENVNGNESFSREGENIKWEAKGNDIYYQGTTDKKAPINVKITYYLDGKEITLDDLAGKSGKVTIRFDYINNEKMLAKINGADEEIYVPFIAVTGLVLGENFTNVEIENGKVISDGKNQVAVGMAMPGMKENLDLDTSMEIPSYVELTADVKGFSIDMTMTVAMCNSTFEIGEIDLTQLDKKINDISDSSNKLYDGSKNLADAISLINSKMPDFQSGVATLKNGIADYTKGTKEINSGINTLYKSSGKLVKGMKSVKKAVDAIYTNFGTKDDEKTIRGGANALAKGANDLNAGVKKLSDGTGKLETGSGKVSENMGKLNNGIKTISGKVSTLNISMKTLKEGANQVKQGVNEFISTINELVDGMKYNEEKIYEQLEESGIESYEEALEALSNAQQLQSVVITSIASDNYTGLEQYGIIDSVSAAGILSNITKKVNSLNKAVTSLGIIDSVISGVNEKNDDIDELSKGVKELANGTAGASDGVDTLNDTLTDLTDSTDKLATGASEVSDGVKDMSSGMTDLALGSNDLDKGAENLKKGIESLYEKAISPLYKGTAKLWDGMPKLKSGIKKLKKGSNKLIANNEKLNDGAENLNEAAVSMKDGMNQLDEGANNLKDGIDEFNNEAIKKLVSTYNGDVKQLVYRINEILNVSATYETFTQKADDVNGNVKFIIKTEGIDAD